MFSVSQHRLAALTLLLLATLITTRAYGQEAFRITIPSIEPARMQPLHPNSDGSFYLFSEMNDGNGLSDSTALLRFSSHGTPIWGRSIVLADQEIEPYAVFTAPDGDIMLTAAIYVPKDGNRLEENNGFLVMRLDSLGNLRWAKRYMSGRGVNGFYSLVLEDGSILISGSRNRDFSVEGDSVSSAFLFRIDAEGSLMWSKSPWNADAGARAFISFGPFCQKRNGRLSGTASFTSLENVSSAEGMILEMTADGEILKGETLLDPETGTSFGYSHFHAIAATTDGGAVAVGEADQGGAYSDFIVSVVDKGNRTKGRLFNISLSIRECIRLSSVNILLTGGRSSSTFVEMNNGDRVARSAHWQPFPDSRRADGEGPSAAYIYTNIHHAVQSDGRILFAAGVDSLEGSNGILLASFTRDFETCSWPTTSTTFSTTAELKFVNADSLRMLPVPLEVHAEFDVRIAERAFTPSDICRSNEASD